MDLSQEPLAIIGMSYRLPGGNDDEHKLWSLLKDGRDTWGKLPARRYNQDAYYHPDPQHAGSIIAPGGHFMDRDPAAFDAPFFGIGPAEASALDPQQRFLLETTYECLESAGVPMEKISGSKTGCFAGCFLHDYDTITSADMLDIPTYAAVGGAGSFLSNRVSWFYNLKGPSLTCDTACSSSLIAFHLACQSVWSGESDQAFAAGANMVLMPQSARSLTQMQFLSPDGRCFSFDDRGNGYGRGEGLVMLLIKPVSAAIRDGDCIRAVVRASAANQNGRTPGITMPSTEAQAILIRTAYEAAGLDFDTTGYFEAHGTGTAIGDPLEWNAIAQTFADSSTRSFPLYVGSVKSNIGHLEGTAGLVGLLKAILCVEKGLIPPLANLKQPNPKLRLDDPNLQLATKLVEWPSSGVRRASVNSFGAGGSNAHVVIDDAASYLQSRNLSGHHRTALLSPSPSSDSGVESGASDDEEQSPYEMMSAPTRLYVFSAPEQAGLGRIATSYAQLLESRLTANVEENNLVSETGRLSGITTKLDLGQLADTLCTRRSMFDWRACIVASSATDFQHKLSKGLHTFAKPGKTSGITFVFSGQGAQNARMGIELLQYHVFRHHLLEADASLQGFGCTWSVVEELSRAAAESWVDNAAYAQPLSTILQTGLVDLLQSWDVTPKAVVGHSSGEIAAAYAAGALSKHDAWKVAYFRGKLSAEVTAAQIESQGAMLAVGLAEDEANAYLADFADSSLVIACVNSPRSITLSGPKPSISRIAAQLKHDQIFHSTLHVKNAYHSPEMLAVAEAYAEAISDIIPLTGSGPVMLSTVTGCRVEASELGASYWVANMLSKVRFTAAMDTLLTPTTNLRGRRKAKLDVVTFLEIGPHSALQAPIQEIINVESEKSKQKTQLSYYSILRHGRDAAEAALETVGQLWTAGHTVNLAKVNQPAKAERALPPLTDLPAYPWNHSEKNHYWYETPSARMVRSPSEPRHDLLGILEDDNKNTPQYRNTLHLDEQPWIAEHEVQGVVVLPATAFISMAIEAAVRSAADGKIAERVELRDVMIQRPLLFQDRTKGIDTRVALKPHRAGTRLSSTTWTHVTISSRSNMDDSWNEHASCYFTLHYKTTTSDVEGISERLREAKACQETYLELKERCRIKNSASTIYLTLEDCGFNYGPLFKNLEDLYCGPPYAIGIVSIPDTRAAMPKSHESPHVVHPIVLDNAIQLINPALRDCGLKSTTMLPTAMESITIDLDVPNSPNAKLRGYSSYQLRGYHDMLCQIVLGAGDFEKPLITIKNLSVQEVAGIMDIDTSDTTQAKPISTELVWKEDIDLLSRTALEQLLRASVRDGNAMPKVHKYILALADLMSFKNPSLTVFEMESMGSQLMERTVARLTEPGQGTRMDSYIMSGRASVKPDWATQGIKQNSDIADYITLKDGEDAELAKHNLVISLHHTIESGSAHATLQRTRASLHTYGKFAFAMKLPPQDPKATLMDVEVMLQLAGFSGIDAAVEGDEDSSLFVITTKLPVSASPSAVESKDIMLVEPPHESVDERTWSLINTFEDKLIAAGHKVSHATIQSLRDSEDKCIVSFLGLGEMTLNQVCSTTYSALRAMLLRNAGLMWVSVDAVEPRRNPFRAMETGLLRVIRSEEPALRLVQFDYSSEMDIGSNPAVELLMTAVKASLLAPQEKVDQHAHEVEIRERDGRLFIPRLFAEQKANEAIYYHTHHPAAQRQRIGNFKQVLRLRTGVPGMLDTLRFAEVDQKKVPMFSTALPPGHAKVRVQATPINFVDVMVAMGMVPSASLGCECAGVVVEASQGGKYNIGDQVVVMTGNAFATHVIDEEKYMQPIPSGMRPAEAASCVTIYVTAYVALVDVARVQPGESVLIHAGAGGLGQAAIQLCQMIGAQIYVTVGSTTKKALLMEKYKIPESHIFNSRDLTFAKGIMRQTEQRGVDVILNSTSGEALRQTWHCIAQFGRFIEVGKRDILANTGLDMEPFLRNASYSGVHIDQMVGPARARVAVAMQKVFALLQAGRVSAVHPVTIMKYSEMEDAFRLVQTGKHTGKVVLTQSDDDIVPVIPPIFEKVKLKSDVTYAIAGGLGGVGQSMVDTMFDQGARHFAFFSRSGDSKPDAKEYIRNLRGRGAQAIAYAVDIADPDALNIVVKRMETEMPAVKGFVNAAMFLQDCLFATMSYEQWTIGIAPKVAGSWNFHNLLPKGLDFFVSLSSISAMIGVPGHANYAAANTFQDALAFYRRSIGENAITLNLSAVFGVGVMEYTNVSRNAYYQSIGINEGELNTLLSFAMKGTTLKEAPCPTVLTTGVTPAQLNTPGLLWTFDPKFRIIRRLGSKRTASLEDGSAKSKLMDELQQCTNMPAVSKTIENNLIVKLAKSMMCSAEDINSNKPLHSFGVDSLIAVEMRNWIFQELKSEVTVFDIMEPQPLSSLCYKIAEKSKLISVEVKAAVREAD